jgi:chromosome segregation ATPase
MCRPAGKSLLGWARAWLLAFALLFCCSGFPAAATERTPESWPPSTLPLKPTVTGLSTRIDSLVSRLEERKSEVESLKQSLAELLQQANASASSYSELLAALQEAVASRDKLAMELTEISSSHAKLQEGFVALKLSSTAYQAEATSQIRKVTRQRNWWRVGGILGMLGGLAGLLFGVFK